MANPKLDALLTSISPEAARTGIMGRAESLFDSVGLMRSPFSPIGRAAVGFGAGWVVMKAISPQWAYDENGQPRPWRYGKDGSDSDAVTFPWWSVPLGGAVLCGVFI